MNNKKNRTIGNRTDDFLTLKEAAEYIGMSQSFLKTLKYGNKIPFYQVGGNIKYKISDLKTYLESCRIESQQEWQDDDATG